MLDTIVTRNDVQFNPAQRAAAQAKARVVMLNIRGIVCAVPRSKCSLEFVQDAEQARDMLINSITEYARAEEHAPGDWSDGVEDAFETYTNAVTRNYEFESQLIARYRVTHTIKGVAFIAGEPAQLATA